MTDAGEQRVERRVLADHGETVAEVCDIGRTVASSWPGDTVTNANQITAPLERLLHDAGLPEQLLEALDTAVDETGQQMTGKPVPAPPYFVVTSRGPACRGTLEDGRRLVLLFELFDVDRRPRTYRFRDPSPDDTMRIRFRGDREGN